MKGSNGGNDSTTILLYIGLIALFAICPPIAVAILLCLVFSGGTVDGFLGCLIPLVVLVLIALVWSVFL